MTSEQTDCTFFDDGTICTYKQNCCIVPTNQYSTTSDSTDAVVTQEEDDPCMEIEITQGCEGTVMSGIVSIYVSYDGPCNDENIGTKYQAVDMNYRVYESLHTGDRFYESDYGDNQTPYFLFRDEFLSADKYWTVVMGSSSPCTNNRFGQNGSYQFRSGEAWWEAGDRPFEEAANEVRCNTEYKQNVSSDFQIRCNKRQSDNAPPKSDNAQLDDSAGRGKRKVKIRNWLKRGFCQ